MLCGIAFNTLSTYLTLYLQREMGADQFTLTMCTLSNTLVQLIAYPLSSALIKRVGALPVITIGLLSYLPRLVLLSYISNPWYGD